MAIDKALYRQAQQWYRQWNEAEQKARREEAGKLSPQEAWERYVDLWEFGWRIKVEPGKHQIQQKIEALERYSKRLKKMEAWRRTRGNK